MEPSMFVFHLSFFFPLSFSLTARQGNAVAGWRNRPIDKLFMDLRTTQ
jgi:hypothetical protein